MITTDFILYSVHASLQIHVPRNNEENRSKRVEIKNLIADLKKVNPFVEANIFKSVENVNLSTVVAYKKDGIKHSFLDDYDNR